MRISNALAIATIVISAPVLADTPAWRISEMSGPVTVGSAGFGKIAQRGRVLAVGDIVSTGVGGRAVLVRGEDYMVVAPNTRFTVADPAKAGALTQIIEQAGNVIFKIRKLAAPHFAVETPFLAAVVKGTTFSVTVSDGGATVQVTEGKVEVATRDGGARYLVLPGDIGAVRATKPGQLEVDGRERRTIVSPTAPDAASPSPLKTTVTSSATSADGRVTVAAVEPPVRLSTLTSGLVSGDIAPARVATATAARAATNPATVVTAAVTVAAPATTATAPVSAATTPVVTAAAPVVTAAAPVVTAVAAPVTTVAAPVATTVAPVVTTAAAPVTTVAAPVVTAAAPVVTAAATPVVTAAAPVVTATAPVVTAVTPVVTAAAPVVAAVTGSLGSNGNGGYSGNGNTNNSGSGGGNGNGGYSGNGNTNSSGSNGNGGNSGNGNTNNSGSNSGSGSNNSGSGGGNGNGGGSGVIGELVKGVRRLIP